MVASRKPKISAFRKSLRDELKPSTAAKERPVRLVRKTTVLTKLDKEDLHEELAEQHKMVAQIMCELQARPERIKKTLKYVMSDWSLPASSRTQLDATTTMEESAKVLSAVPVAVLEKAVDAVGAARGQLRDMRRLQRRSKRKNLSLSILCREAAFETNVDNTFFDVAKFVECAVARSRMVRFFFDIPVDADDAPDIDGEASSWYTLVHSPGSQVEYNAVTLDGKFTAPLPRGFRVDTTWVVRDHLSLQFASVVPPASCTGLPKTLYKRGVNLFELFNGDEAVRTFYKSLVECGPEPDGAATPGSPSSSEAFATPDKRALEPSTPRLRISASKLKALMK